MEGQGDAQGSSLPRSGPLTGFRFIEFVGLGPAPFAAMMLADMGATILRIDRAGSGDLLGLRHDPLARGRETIALDLKAPGGVALTLDLIAASDALIEGFRPGIMERLGLGPEPALARQPRLVYGRMTGWGQAGPLAQAAGHDLNYIALSGALHAIGPALGGPAVPLNLIGDFGAGGMLLAFGMLAALLEAQKSGQGQVVDAAISDGTASLMAMIYALHSEGKWRDARGANLLDGGAPFYACYRCADGQWVSIASVEPKFFALLAEGIGFAPGEFPNPRDSACWPAMRARLAAAFAAQPRDYWIERFEGSDICFAPVLSLADAPHHPHNVARNTFVKVDGRVEPAPAPRFSRTPPGMPQPDPGRAAGAILADWGIAPAMIAAANASGALKA